MVNEEPDSYPEESPKLSVPEPQPDPEPPPTATKPLIKTNNYSVRKEHGFSVNTLYSVDSSLSRIDREVRNDNTAKNDVITSSTKTNTPNQELENYQSNKKSVVSLEPDQFVHSVPLRHKNSIAEPLSESKSYDEPHGLVMSHGHSEPKSLAEPHRYDKHNNSWAQSFSESNSHGEPIGFGEHRSHGEPGGFSEPEGHAEHHGSHNGSWAEPWAEKEYAHGEATTELERHLYIFIFLALIVTIVLLNSILLITTTRRKFLRREVRTVFMQSVFVAGICVACFVIPAQVAGYFSDNLPPVVCQLCEYFSHLAASANTFSQTALAIYMHQFWVMNHRITFKQARVAVAWIWFSSAVYAVRAPLLFNLVTVIKRNTDGNVFSFVMCSGDRYHELKFQIFKIVLLIDFVLLFLIPLCVISFSYIAVVKTLLNSVTGKTEDKVIKASIKVFILMVMFLAICQSPNRFLSIILNVFGVKSEWAPLLIPLFFVLAYSNSVANPVVALALNPVVKKGVYFTILEICWKKKFNKIVEQLEHNKKFVCRNAGGEVIHCEQNGVGCEHDKYEDGDVENLFFFIQ